MGKQELRRFYIPKKRPPLPKAVLAGQYARPERAQGPVQRSWLFPVLMVVVPITIFLCVFLLGIGGHPALGAGQAQAMAADVETADFELCGSGQRIDCVIDGDTFWYHGQKIRIADINTPELSDPACADEARLARRATGRLQGLLNQGAFTLAPNPDGRDTDRYGRLLRVVERGGASLGDVLVAEGLAEEWQGFRKEWC